MKTLSLYWGIKKSVTSIWKDFKMYPIRAVLCFCVNLVITNIKVQILNVYMQVHMVGHTHTHTLITYNQML